jgi:putative protein-disulfide isomerase
MRTLYYVHDPMCSWCYAFQPAWSELKRRLAQQVIVQGVLGGLAPDTDAPMPDATRAYVQANWRRIMEVVPAIQFNFDFWTRCQPRRATYPACRAVIAAAIQGTEFEEPMIDAIQRAYYRDARNPSDPATLQDLAREIGLDTSRFAEALNSPATQAELLRQIEFSRRIGARGFPSLVLATNAGFQLIEHDYHDVDHMLRRLL